jgi:hypothetical protein
MVNLRYHIVSLTAVFLALGIGLTLGSSFLDRVTVDTLNNQLTALEGQIGETRVENRALSRRAGALADRDALLSEQLGERVLSGRLAEVPILVIATAGTDEAWVERTMSALGASGARVSGTWWLTDRFSLEDEAQVTDLAGALGLTTTHAERLRRSATVRLADVLLDAAETTAEPADEAAEVGQEGEAGDAEPGDPGAEPTAPDPALPPEGEQDGAGGPDGVEPELLAALRAAGYVEYQQASSDAEGPVRLRPTGMRYVIVSGGAPDDAAEPFLRGLVAELARTGPVPVVVAQGSAGDLPPGHDDEETSRTTAVGELRADEELTARLSTVDSLDTAAGLLALVLALEDLAEGTTGHYGVTGSAMRLLPPRLGEP